MYLQCYTAQEIAEVVGLEKRVVELEINGLCEEMETTSKTYQTANYLTDFDIPIYNRFSYGKVTIFLKITIFACVMRMKASNNKPSRIKLQ